MSDGPSMPKCDAETERLIVLGWERVERLREQGKVDGDPDDVRYTGQRTMPPGYDMVEAALAAQEDPSECVRRPRRT